jgi:hypothetical protein
VELKNFFKSTVKIAIALVIAAIALSVIAWIVWKVDDSRTKQEAKQYEVIKEWSIDLKAILGMQLYAKTKVIDNKLLMSVQIDGYPAYLSDSRLIVKNRDATIKLFFLDHDGFRVFEKSLTVSELSSVVDSSGKKTGLSHQFDEYISVDGYKRFARLTAQWTLDTEVPVAQLPEPASATPLPDHCAPNLSKAERLRRLSQHGKVRETGLNEYTAGLRAVHFLTSTELLSCK